MRLDRRVTVHAIDVYWGDGYGNDPSLKFLVEGLRDHNWRYEKRPCVAEQLSSEQVAIVGLRQRQRTEGWHIYFAERDGFARFFTWGGKPDDGFGGRRRTVTLVDGSTEEIVGGWHVTPDAASDVGFSETLDVTVVDTEYVAEIHNHDPGRDWTRISGLARFVTLERCRRELAAHRPDLELVRKQIGGWTVKWRGQPSKSEWMAAGPGNDRRNRTCVESGDVYSRLGVRA